ncbi:MAG: hypothetical protein RJA22_232 [Verrucomicrobiota bacterium]|jgi:hypothetical protein
MILPIRRQFAKMKHLALALASLLSVQAAVRAQEAGLGLNHPKVQPALAAQAAVTGDLMKLPGVLGTAIGAGDKDDVALVVFVDQDSPSRADLVRSLPPQVRGVALKVHLTDAFRAFAGNTAKQALPIKLGTSGSWRYDSANGYCCGGTLGSLITVNGTQYIMSNFHVLEGDIVSGGNGRVVSAGDPVIHPALIDLGCNAANAHLVGTMVPVAALPNNNVDVAVAQVVPGAVDPSGSILGIGVLSSTTLSPSLRLGVKKSGRTTGLTSSSISGLNATISVSYSRECGGGTAFTKTFTGQIVISNSGSKFLKGGDSGSLMVENRATNPRAVGLLYAGSSTSAIANPINQVLTFLSGKLGGTATMVGN